MKQTTASPAYVLAADEGTALPWFGGDKVVIKAGGEATAGSFSVIEDEGGPGSGIALHVHENDDEAFYVLAGTYTVTCGDETIIAEPGAFVYLPRGVPHAHRLGDAPGRRLVVTVPSGFDHMFQELSAAIVAGEMTIERRNTIAAKHGITFLG